MQCLRNLFNYFVLLLFLAASVGISVNKHYCKGRLAQVSFWESIDPCCEKETEGNQYCSGCCSDEVILLSIEDNFQKKHFEGPLVQWSTIKQPRIDSYQSEESLLREIQSDRAPPEATQKLYILYQSLKLYA